MIAVVGLVHVKQETSHWDLIDAQFGVLRVHGERDQTVGLGHLAAALTRDLETWSVVCHEYRSLHVLSCRHVSLELELEERGTEAIRDLVRLVMQCIDHEKHLNEAHDAHTLTTSRRVELLSEIKAATIWVPDKRLQEASVLAEVRAEIEQEVGLRRLEVVRLDGVDRLREGAERHHVIDCCGHDVGSFEVIERCGGPTVGANDSLVLVLSNPIFNSLNRHSLARRHLNLEVGALVL